MLRKVLLACSYLAVAAVVVVATIVLVAYGQGYSYNFKTNSFNLNGLLMLDSSPQGAQISINGKPIRHKTPYRTTLETGTYSVDVIKEGYVPWHRSVEIKASEVSYLPQIVLVPTNPKVDTVASDGPIKNLVATKDGRHFAFITDGPSAAVWVLNPDRKQTTKVYTPRGASGDQPAETLSTITWSDDGSHLLIRSQVGPTVNYLVVASSGGAATNLTDLFKFDLTGITFSPNDWRELYWVSPEGLRRINVEAQTVSAVLVEKVSAFTFAGDRLVYIQSTALGKTLSSSDRSGREPKRLIESIAESASYQMQYANYRGLEILAVLPAQATTATAYIDVFSATPLAKVLSKSAQQISFSQDGRYLAFNSEKMLGSYDFEKEKMVTVELPDAKLSSVTWFDNAHLLLSHDGKVELSEFDYGNPVTISKTTYSGAAFGTNDQRRILWLSGTEGNYKISITEIKP